MQRFGIDVRYLSHGLVGGVHTYVRHLVPALIKQAADCEIVLYADTRAPLELSDLPARVTVRVLPWSSPLSTIKHDLLMPRIVARDRLDAMHFPANYGIGPNGVPTVVTIHDAINLLPLREIVRGHPKRPGTIAKMTYLHAWTRLSARRAAVILTVSEHAGREIARHGGIDPFRVVPIPHAPTPDLYTPADPELLALVRERFGIARPFVMADALKNPATLTRAWRLLPPAVRASHELIFFSRRPEVPDAVTDAERRGEARLLLRPSREELIALYRQARAFAFPSWIEGFGIPVLEAMTLGAPVIASDRGAIPEVAGGAALLADAEDAAGFAAHLEAVLTRPALADDLRARGLARSADFSWSGTAARTLAAYRRAALARAALTPQTAGSGSLALTPQTAGSGSLALTPQPPLPQAGEGEPIGTSMTTTGAGSLTSHVILRRRQGPMPSDPPPKDLTDTSSDDGEILRPSPVILSEASLRAQSKDLPAASSVREILRLRSFLAPLRMTLGVAGSQVRSGPDDRVDGKSQARSAQDDISGARARGAHPQRSARVQDDMR